MTRNVLLDSEPANEHQVLTSISRHEKDRSVIKRIIGIVSSAESQPVELTL